MRLALAALVVGVFLWALALQLEALRSYRWQIAPAYLVLAAIVALARGATVVYPWWRIVQAWGYPLGWWSAVNLYFRSGLARYLPGQYWYILSRAYLAEGKGVPKAATAASTLVETVLLTGTAAAIALIGSATLPTGWTALLLLASGVGTLAALLAGLPLLAKASDRILRVGSVGSQETRSSRLRVAAAVPILLVCCANWLFYGTVAALLTAGLAGSEHLAQAPAVVGLFTASVLGGSLGLLVPQGIVIREGVLIYLLQSLLGVPVPAGVAIAAFSRILAMSAEGVWVLATLRIRSYKL